MIYTLQIKTVKDYWIWLEGTLLPSLYALKYFNGTEIDYWQDAACISDMESRRVGVARIRQMRVKNGTFFSWSDLCDYAVIYI